MPLWSYHLRKNRPKEPESAAESHALVERDTSVRERIASIRQENDNQEASISDTGTISHLRETSRNYPALLTNEALVDDILHSVIPAVLSFSVLGSTMPCDRLIQVPRALPCEKAASILPARGAYQRGWQRHPGLVRGSVRRKRA